MCNQIVTNLNDIHDQKGKALKKTIKINLFVIYEASQSGRRFSEKGRNWNNEKICDAKSYKNS